MVSLNAKTWLLCVALLAGLFFQGWRLLGNVGQNLFRVRGTIGQTGLWRSANFGQNQRFADYIQFLNENIPTKARVVLPPQEPGLKVLSITPYMQFFLAPRQVINCTDAACLQIISGENTYFLVVRDFPDARSSAPARVVLFHIVFPEIIEMYIAWRIRSSNRFMILTPRDQELVVNSGA